MTGGLFGRPNSKGDDRSGVQLLRGGGGLDAIIAVRGEEEILPYGKDHQGRKTERRVLSRIEGRRRSEDGGL